MSRHRRLAVALTLAGIAVPAASAQAAPVGYVDQNPAICSDARTLEQATAATAPLCSLGRAFATAPAGWTIVARAGRYPQISLANYSRADYVKLQAQPGETVEVAGVQIRHSDHVRFQGLRITSRFDVIEGGHDLQIVGNDIGNQRSGLYFFGDERVPSDVHNVLIEGNSIHDIDYTGGQGVAEGYGIVMAGIVRGVSIRGNTIKSVAEDYIQGGSSDITVEGNTFLGPGLRSGHPDAHADLWQIFGSAQRITFRSNVVRGTQTNTGILFQFTGSMPPHEDITVENNLFDRGSDGAEIQIYNTRNLRLVNNTIMGSRWGTMIRDEPSVADGTNYTIVNNILDSRECCPLNAEARWPMTQSNNIMTRGGGRTSPTDFVNVQPQFVNPGAGDFHLAAGSRAIDAGTPNGATSSDLEGTPRDGKPDIGAYEVGRARPVGGSAAAPELGRLTVAPRQFRVAAARGSRRARRRGGTTFRFTSSVAARTTFTIQRRSRGRRVGDRCRPRGRRSRGRACARYRAAGRFVRNVAAGANQVRFTGRIGGKRLRRGWYRVRVRATTSAGRSAVRQARFAVRR